MRPNIKATGILLVAFFCTAAFAAPEDSKAETRVYYALADEHNAPLRDGSESFDCTDQIYTVLEAENFALGQHQLSVKWIDPSGRQREHTQYPFHVHGSHEHRLWAWLSLSRATGAGMLTFINPAAGLEEFIGEWTIEVRISGELIDSGNFSVVC